MARKALNTTYGFTFDGSGTGSNNVGSTGGPAVVQIVWAAG